VARESIETLIDRWTKDPAFRSAVRADPEAALAASGIVLDAEEREALAGMDWSLSDQQIEQRVSKSGC
jgi:hypothetical protein